LAALIKRQKHKLIGYIPGGEFYSIDCGVMQHHPRGTEFEGNTRNIQNSWEKEAIMLLTLFKCYISVQLNIGSH
jgi:hypothetical protein